MEKAIPGPIGLEVAFIVNYWKWIQSPISSFPDRTCSADRKWTRDVRTFQETGQPLENVTMSTVQELGKLKSE